jgi:hypothetical protein
MGGTLRRGEGAQARHIQAGQRGRRRTHQRLKHPAATSLLPLERISKFFCKLRTQHPSWLYRCKSHRVNKVKGQLGFSQETQVTLGGYYGGHPPPRKNGPFFRKNSQARQVRLDLSLGQTQIECGQPSGKDVRVGDSLRLQQDTALLPRLRTGGPLVRSNLSTSISPKERKTGVEQRGKRNKSFTSIYKMFKQISCSLHGHMAPTLTLKQKRARHPVVFRLEGRRCQEHLGIRSRRNPQQAYLQQRR